MLVASLEATAFSVIAKQERMEPRSSGTSHARCCSGVPYLGAGECVKGCWCVRWG